MAAEQLAQRFHETYERLAPAFGYETRKESARPWAEVPEQNRRLMIAVCAEILGTTDVGHLVEARRIVQEWLDKQGNERCWYYPDLFHQLADCLEVTPATEPDLPSRPEFEEGCRRYQHEQYAKAQEVTTMD
jgi:hypothetical protein